MSKEELEEKKKRKKKKKKAKAKVKRDACYHKVKRRYKVWPSAYASGALVKCRKVGAKNWGNKSKKKNESLSEEKELTADAVKAVFKKEGGALGMKALKKVFTKAKDEEIQKILDSMEDVGEHDHGDYVRGDGDEIKITKEQLNKIIEEELDAVLDEKKKKRKKRKKAGTESSKESSLRDWFGRKGAKGKKKGWVDCNAPDGKGGYKSCGRGSGEKRKKYPACRPTPGACKERGKGKSWGKKGSKKKRNESMKLTNEQLSRIIKEELEAILSEKEGKKDACYHKVKARYDVWPSAYASGALSKCRKVGAKNWGNKSKKNEDLHEVEITDEEEEELEDVSKQLKGAVKAHGNQAKAIDKAIKNEEEMEEAKKKKPCKPSKGKRFAKRVDGKCRSFGQKGQAKGGGDRIRPGTKKGDAYCARSAKIKKCKNPPCANDLSRKKWKCRGSKSMRENKEN